MTTQLRAVLRRQATDGRDGQPYAVGRFGGDEDGQVAHDNQHDLQQAWSPRNRGSRRKSRLC